MIQLNLSANAFGARLFFRRNKFVHMQTKLEVSHLSGFHFAYNFLFSPGESKSSLASVKFGSLANLASVKIILFPPR